MKPSGKNRFNEQYRRHLGALKLQGMSDKTIDVYSRAIRRIATYFDCCPDHISTDHDGLITFKYIDSRTGKMQTIGLTGQELSARHQAISIPQHGVLYMCLITSQITGCPELQSEAAQSWAGQVHLLCYVA